MKFVTFQEKKEKLIGTLFALHHVCPTFMFALNALFYGLPYMATFLWFALHHVCPTLIVALHANFCGLKMYHL